METRSVRTVVYLGGGFGLILALFAAAEYFDSGLRTACSFGSFFSCGAVDNSGLTNTLGIPDYLWGIGGFLVILVVAGLAERFPGDPRWTYALVAITSAGVALSLYLLYVELALVHALCPVCASAYVFGGVAWVGAIALSFRPPDEPPDDDDPDDES